MPERTVYETPAQVPEHEWIYDTGIILRPITHADTGDIVRWRNDAQVRDHFVFREPFTTQMHETWLKEKVGTGQAVQWMICEEDAGNTRAVGSVYLRDIDPAAKRAEYGIFIGEAHARGRGYAVKTARLILREAFLTLHLETVGLRVYEDNEQAMKGYLAAGFRIVRTLKDVESTDGTRGDMLWMEAKPGI